MVGRKRSKTVNKNRATEEALEEVAAKNARIDELERELAANNTALPEVLVNAIGKEYAHKLGRIGDLEKELSKTDEKIEEIEKSLPGTNKSYKAILKLKDQQIKNLETRLADVTAKEENLALTTGIFSHDCVSIRTIFTNLSSIGQEGFLTSKKVISERCEWALEIRKSPDYLGAYISAGSLKDSRTSVGAYAKIRFLSHRDLSVLYQFTFPCVTTFQNGKKWGRSGIIPLEKLLDINENFVKDDSIILEALIKEIDVPA